MIKIAYIKNVFVFFLPSYLLNFLIGDEEGELSQG